MGFFDALRHVLGRDHGPEGERTGDPRIIRAWGLDRPAADAGQARASGDASAYDRLQWHKKLNRIMDELPGSRAEWDNLMTEARALELDPEWVAKCQVDEFFLLIRRAVSDRVFTEEEHRTLDLARKLIGLSEEEAETAFHAIVAEAESFFGKPVEET
jgi:hypothetical protein